METLFSVAQAKHGKLRPFLPAPVVNVRGSIATFPISGNASESSLISFTARLTPREDTQNGLKNPKAHDPSSDRKRQAGDARVGLALNPTIIDYNITYPWKSLRATSTRTLIFVIGLDTFNEKLGGKYPHDVNDVETSDFED
ncbi:hypothetical protein RND71_033809 [Anisodus tanguticus]|uniref:Uncharacterized protein n=1 Tax=Anisodus tanguticus TaxID=243964 RepID=A0AAE1V4B3_9SOLA|nr:hypothetical protein RND71_033809 [Anisodus tanguticus]